MKIALTLLIAVHGSIHLLGFVKAFHLGNITQLTKEISKLPGTLWLLTAIAFGVTILLFILKKEYWWMIALTAAIISQVLIITAWQDAKFGTIANIIIFAVALLSGGNYLFERRFMQDVSVHLHLSQPIQHDLVTLADIEPLPIPVQRYLKYVGVVDKPKVKNVCIVFEGEMRQKDKDWFPFTSRQYNFFEQPSRLFFMKARMFGITVPGYHHYTNEKAKMDVRLFGMIPVSHHSGPLMNKAETVTFFNDMCMFAPAALIDKRIRWKPIDNNTVLAHFTNGDITISATLYFNDIGQLIDFRSDDRTDVSVMKQYTFSTPAKDYRIINGYQLAHFGEAIWMHPEGAFVYGKFQLKEVKYNEQGRR
ncbi:MAG: hypothetical protein RBS07_16420 [Lentimicrobium sp.]|jgi:hypothetical protein|nr:hypothetical protein [Lentimicrobium sp.]